MSTKQKFLDQLRADLRKYPSGDVDDYIAYYDELISERIANGEKESAVLQQIGSPGAAAASFKQDNAIKRAIKKPTVSNGFKALIAVLGVLSLPLLVPVAVLIIALLVTALALFVSGLAVLVFGVIAAVLSVIDMAAIVAAGDAPFYLLLLVAGAALIIVFLAFELLRGLLFLGRWAIRSFVQKLKSRRDRRQQLDQAVTSEEQ